MPVDGVVIEGQSEIDRSLLTGESLPAFAGPDTVVAAGEVNLTGPLAGAGDGGGPGQLVCTAWPIWWPSLKTPRPATPRLPNALRVLYSPSVHLLSFGAFAVWMWITGGDMRYSINISAAVLIITCPCALGLAVPAVVTAASGRLFRKGLLIKDGTALERLAEVDVVVFDKTGTLTLGAPTPVNLADHDASDLGGCHGFGGGIVASVGRGIGQSRAGAGDPTRRRHGLARSAGLWCRRALARSRPCAWGVRIGSGPTLWT